MTVSRWSRLPLRVRLVAGFAAAMAVVLTGAGSFVYARVQYALDLRLDEDLSAESARAVTAATTRTLSPAPGVPGAYYQLVDADDHVTASSAGAPRTSLLDGDELHAALRAPLRRDRGALLPIREARLRVLARRVPGPDNGSTSPVVVAVAAVVLDQRDEALRELLAQLALANIAALLVASVVSYRLARAALAPVERYRSQAAAVAAGATGVRLAVLGPGIDEVSRLGTTLNDMLAALEEAVARERRFVGDASHELRTPLSLLSAELELALRRPRSRQELEAAVRAAAGDVAGLVRLTDHLLTLASAGAPVSQAERTDLASLVADLAGRFRPRLQEAGRDVVLHISGRPSVGADQRRLGQVVANLLENATVHGGGAVSVTVGHEPTSGEVRLVVSDAGPGISEAFLPSVAERFSRADAARTTPGTGLGLSIVAALVEAQAGELRVCSAGRHHRVHERFAAACWHPRSGTSVTVLLPQR